MKNTGYKLFRVVQSRPGELFPLYVNANKATQIGEWIQAEYGEMTENGKVKSKLGKLCFRPGWHLSDLPIATHIGVKNSQGEIEFIKPDNIWCECEYSDKINYQMLAYQNGMNDKGVIIPQNAYLKDIPYDGFYRYKTSPHMTGDWIIAGSIKINRILSDAEVADILKKKGIRPMARYGGEFDAKKYGIVI